MYSRLPRVLRFHMKLFIVMGYMPLATRPQYSRRWLIADGFLRVWPILIFLEYCALTVNTLIAKDDFMFTADSFGYFNDLLQLSVAQVTVTAIYMESIFRRGSMRMFWLLHSELAAKKQPDEKGGILLAIRQNWRFLGIFYGLLLLEFIVISVTFLNNDIPRHAVLFWCMFYPYWFSAHFRNMVFILHMEVIRQELENLKDELAELVDYIQFATRIAPFKGFEEFLRRKLADKQRKHTQIYEMFENFQKSFGYSMLAVLLLVYVRVLVDTYFTYYTLYRFDQQYENLLILPALFEIPVFLITSKNCMEVVKHITFQLHNIMRKVDDLTLSLQIQNFSLQILHLSIKINGMGITTMDGYMLTKAVGSVTTYMIFFIQFMPKFRNL